MDRPVDLLALREQYVAGWQEPHSILGEVPQMMQVDNILCCDFMLIVKADTE